MRLALLGAGCAVIADRTAVSPEEIEAENKAKASGLRRWLPYPQVSSGEESSVFWQNLAAFGAWLLKDWMNILGLILGILGLSWVAARIDRFRKGRKIDVVLAGLPSAGKTDLWKAWRDDLAPKSDSSPTAGSERMTDLQPVPYGKYTVYPQIVDTAGSDPALVVRAMRKKRRWSNRVLLIVLSPTRRNVALASTDSVDEDFVAEQRGFMSLPQALLGNYRKLKPKAVVIFVSKFDLVASSHPYDSSSKKALARIEQHFKPHRDAMAAQCEKAGVEFEFIVGSAKSGWGVRELRDVVNRKVVQSR